MEGGEKRWRRMLKLLGDIKCEVPYENMIYHVWNRWQCRRWWCQSPPHGRTPPYDDDDGGGDGRAQESSSFV